MNTGLDMLVFPKIITIGDNLLQPLKINHDQSIVISFLRTEVIINII